MRDAYMEHLIEGVAKALRGAIEHPDGEGWVEDVAEKIAVLAQHAAKEAAENQARQAVDRTLSDHG